MQWNWQGAEVWVPVAFPFSLLTLPRQGSLCEPQQSAVRGGMGEGSC